MKILGVEWFCGRANIGIVRVETEFSGIEYRMTTCSGLDKTVDVQHIADYGSPFPSDAGDVLFRIKKAV